MQATLLVILLSLASMIAGYLLPHPPGKYNVTLTTGSLVDHSRNDPYAPTPTPRALMLSVFQPAICESTIPVPYMPNKTAEYQGPYLEEHFNITVNLSPLFLEARLPVCPAHPIECPDRPILLLSPGYGIPRLYYNVLASAIASEGFTVITIDHPYDANIIVYPNGQAIYNNVSIWSPSNPTYDVYPRAADASFIIDQLSNKTAMSDLFPQGVPKTKHIGMLGHSLGGATAIIAASRDPRILAAINWDGTIFGSLPESGMKQPVLLVSEANVTVPDPTWTSAWKKFKGPKLWIEVENSTHQTYSDVPSLLKAAGVSQVPFEGLLGTIKADKMVGILVETTREWMGGAFRRKMGKGIGRMDGVEVVREGNF